MSNLLWVDKYKPNNVTDIFGNMKQIEEIKNWLKIFKGDAKPTASFKNGLLLSGPPGIGKTSIAHILLRDMDYDIIEFNASELRTSKVICDKLNTILSGKSIKTMFDKSIRTGIIMDEVDGIESKRECSATDLSEFINYTFIREQVKLKRINKTLKKVPKKKLTKICVNVNPIICICNFINKSVTALLKDVHHIRFTGPSENDILRLLIRINTEENLQLNTTILNLIIPYCQNDLRRTINLIEYIAGFIKTNENANTSQLIEFINKIGNKDMDRGLFEAINTIFFTQDSSVETLLQCYHTDQNFIPFIVHENFINFVDKNTNNNYEAKLDICIQYYDNLTASQMFRDKVFGNWYISEYIGFLSSVYPNSLLKNSNLKDTFASTNLNKSALISKYNYRYYNLKAINYLCKKLHIDIQNFQILAALVINTVFYSPKMLDNYIQLFNKYKVTFKEFEKIMKLSPVFISYSKQWTKKFQKTLIGKFDDNIY
jgi:DNA polymerase III delta prime subunit